MHSPTAGPNTSWLHHAVSCMLLYSCTLPFSTACCCSASPELPSRLRLARSSAARAALAVASPSPSAGAALGMLSGTPCTSRGKRLTAIVALDSEPASGSPYPPAPGVMMISLSPASNLTVALPPRFTVRPLVARTSRLRPGAPGLPPSSPNGAVARRSDRMPAVSGRRASSSLTTPSPPRHLPSPPDPGRSAKRRSTTGYLRSSTSGSVMRVFVMCVCTPLRPCHPGPAPAPPAMVS
mmetsp:Transcript_20861/g.53060  ORF Transcript_20861/g.53060 Transcript_20861/m.53060 type:complete len:238 (+) Transcript_20861:40-753(+)